MISSKSRNKLRSVFITGTDTEIGKTVVTGLLGRYLLEKGYNVVTQKWIQTGCSGFSEDIDTHLKLMGLKESQLAANISEVCPYVFKFPASAHLSANLEKKKINSERIKKSFRDLSEKFNCVLAEGLGGALVPYNSKKTVTDIAADLKLPALLVVGNKLGAINHTLLTIEALKKRKMNILGIVFNNLTNDGDKIILDDNPKIIKKISGERVFGTLKFLKNKDILYKSFEPVAKKILACLKSKGKNG